MTSPEAQQGDRAVSSSETTRLKSEIYTLLQKPGLPKAFSEKIHTQLRTYRYSDAELDWMLRQVTRQVEKILLGA
jgi:hypothetical protein